MYCLSRLRIHSGLSASQPRRFLRQSTLQVSQAVKRHTCFIHVSSELVNSIARTVQLQIELAQCFFCDVDGSLHLTLGSLLAFVKACLATSKKFGMMNSECGRVNATWHVEGSPSGRLCNMNRLVAARNGNGNGRLSLVELKLSKHC